MNNRDFKFQNYVILDSNETSSNIEEVFYQFQNYVILDSNETHICWLR